MHRLVAAVDKEMATDGVIKGAGGGDGGLFDGIIARYLALVATTLPDLTPEDAAASDTARTIVVKSAQAAWDNRQTVDGLPLFGPFWDRNADMPTADAEGPIRRGCRQRSAPERDLSVQLSGWMLMEAAHAAEQHRRLARSRSMTSSAPVAVTTSSTVTPGASSRSTSVPSPGTSMTREVGDDPVDDALAGQRQGAGLDDLRVAVAVGVLHQRR